MLDCMASNLQMEIMQMSIEKVIEYIVLLSGWIFAIGIKGLVSRVMDKVAARYVTKEVHEKELLYVKDALRTIEANMKDALKTIEAKIDKLMEL